MVVTAEDRYKIVFFDVETTVPTRAGQRFAILEFGAILVCPRKLVELRNYSTLVRPADLSHISSLSVRCNGISKEAVVSAPSFADISGIVYDLLQGRIWAGHNILKFDCARIREAFAEINRPPPEPKGALDSLVMLRQKFGRRAGDMKMASLATYFGLGQQTHRSLDDVRMNLEVLKYCATVLFLESSFPDVFTDKSWVSPNATTRSRSNGKVSLEQTGESESPASSSVNAVYFSASSSMPQSTVDNHPILSLMTPNTGEVNSPLIEPNPVGVDPFNMGTLGDEMESECLRENSVEGQKTGSPSDECSTSLGYEHSYYSDNFLEPEDISVASISAILAPFYGGHQKIQILCQTSPLQIQYKSLKVRFGISSKFVDSAGRPKLSFVVDAPTNLCTILEKVDSLAQKLSMDSGSSSDWRLVVNRKPGFYNSPTVRLHLRFAAEGETTPQATEVYEEDSSGTRRLAFNLSYVEEVDSLFSPGNLVDACFSADSYDYQQNAGIQLVARKLIVRSSRSG